METLIKIYDFLSKTCETPAIFGLFHLIGALCVVATTVLLVLLLRNASSKGFRVAMLIIWLVLVVGEFLRQTILGYGGEVDGAIQFTLQWYLFPFQLCSSPLYLLPLVILLPDGRVRNAVMAFLGTFSFFGGLAVVIYPPEVLCGYEIINYQAFTHHGLQVVIGIICMVKLKESGLTFKRYLSSIPVFIVMAGIALALDCVMHDYFVSNGQDVFFDLYYISPYHVCAIPILSIIDQLLPFPAFLAIYVFGFALAALLMFYAQKLVISIFSHRSPRKIRRINKMLRKKAGI